MFGLDFWLTIIFVILALCAFYLSVMYDHPLALILGWLFLVCGMGLLSVNGLGTVRNIHWNHNLLSSGHTYQVLGTIAGADVVAIQEIPNGNIVLYTVGDWKIPQCFVEKPMSDETQFQSIDCPK